MKPIHVSSTELARSLGELLGRLRFRGESFVIERNGKPVARLTPYEDPGLKTVAGALTAWRAGGPRDLDWADALDEIGRLDAPPEEPWASS